MGFIEGPNVEGSSGLPQGIKPLFADLCLVVDECLVDTAVLVCPFKIHVGEKVDDGLDMVFGPVMTLLLHDSHEDLPSETDLVPGEVNVSDSMAGSFGGGDGMELESVVFRGDAEGVTGIGGCGLGGFTAANEGEIIKFDLLSGIV
ncbi:hypothetical protein AX17_005949 [Amanita inopinata Kibby_2008]|nr:hypothetical protein AX17_005949 [Amanita inopinata Kibby_2008]